MKNIPPIIQDYIMQMESNAVLPTVRDNFCSVLEGIRDEIDRAVTVYKRGKDKPKKKGKRK